MEVPGHDGVGEAKRDFISISEEKVEVHGGEPEEGGFLVAMVPDVAVALLLDMARGNKRARLPTHGNSSDNCVGYADLDVGDSIF